MQNQEKHPIDELFASRLRDAEQMPSARAWGELQRRTAKERTRKPAFWLYAVAASVLLLAGCFFWLDFGKSVPNAVATKSGRQPPTQNSVAQRTDKPAGKTKTVRDPETNNPETIREKQRTASNGQLSVEGGQLPQKQDGKTARKKIRMMESRLAGTTKPIIDQKESAENAMAKVADGLIAGPIQSENRNNQSMATETIDLAARTATNENTPVNVTIVTVEIEDTPEKETVAPPKNGKAGKLWQALKKAKNAELNLDKGTLVSWVKDKTNMNRERQ